MPNWHLNVVELDRFPSGQYVDKNNCSLRVRDGKALEKTGKPLKSLVASTFEKAITYVFAESPIRNAEVRGSIPLCSTNQIRHLQPPALVAVLVL